ncbi:MAG: FAD-dependent oxidoreductase [Granulosicoccus sp.]
MTTYRSWGMPAAQHQAAIAPAWPGEAEDFARYTNTGDSAGANSFLAFGNGRSYGDSCLNSSGTLVHTRYLNKILDFDKVNGRLRAQPGVTMRDILSLVLPAGWCVPVSPGTSFVTLGGAVANDVHGKNHHARGSFGRHVRQLTLLRSSGEIFECSPDSHSELFRASIGGLGLTGLMLAIEISLIPVKGPLMDCLNIPFHGLDEFIELSKTYEATHEYTVAWLDCLSTGDNEARGIFTAANHSPIELAYRRTDTNRLSVPFNFPSIALNRLSISAFNSLYYYANARASRRQETVPIDKLFYPLDAIGHWNRIYGVQGFYQFQFVVPPDQRTALVEVMARIRRSGLGSFLAVLKIFGDSSSPGMLSFPRPGFCLALDFAYRRDTTERLLKELEAIVIAADGAIYPAKDRLMSAASFEASFPDVRKFMSHTDPACQSDYWQRVKPKELIEHV